MEQQVLQVKERLFSDKATTRKVGRRGPGDGGVVWCGEQEGPGERWPRVDDVEGRGGGQ